MKHKQQQTSAQQSGLPRIFFTYEQLLLLQEALEPVEHYLAKPDSQPVNKELARDVLTNLQAKLQRMIDEQVWNTDVPMDANEILTLQAALTVFSFRLQALLPSQERDTSLRNCSFLLRQFTLVAATLPSS